MHCMVVIGVLVYGADASASHVARPRCRVAIDRETFSSTTTKQPVFSPLLRKIRLHPSTRAKWFFGVIKISPHTVLPPIDVEARGRANTGYPAACRPIRWHLLRMRNLRFSPKSR